MLEGLRRIWSAVRDHPISGREPIRAALRIAWWQLRRRLTSRPMRIAFVNGTRLLVFPRRSSSTAVWYLHLPDPDDMLFALHLLRPGDLFVDGGANVGVWSVLAGSTGADVLSVEPIPDTFSLLERQFAANRFAGKVRAVRAALADVPGTVRMTLEQDAGNKVVEDGGAEIPAVTLDDVVAPGATLIKLDLEGYELEALRGGFRTLTSPSLLALVVETFRRHNWELPKLRAIEHLLGEAGFRPFEYDPDRRVLVPLRGLEVKPEPSGNNTIYVRASSAVADRLRTAARVRIGWKEC